MKSLIAFVAIAALSIGTLIVAFWPERSAPSGPTAGQVSQVAVPAAQAPAVAATQAPALPPSPGTFSDVPCTNSAIPGSFAYTAVGAAGTYVPCAIDSATVPFFSALPQQQTILWAIGQIGTNGIGIAYQSTSFSPNGPRFQLLLYGNGAPWGQPFPLTVKNCSPLTLTCTIPSLDGSGPITITCVGQ